MAKGTLKRSYLVVGAAVSGLAAADLLLKKGHRVRLCDSRKIPDKVRAQYGHSDLEFREKDQSVELLQGIDALVLSPVIAPQMALVQEAIRQKKAVLTEIDLALSYFKGTVIGVTGTNGKSTTCVMLEHLLAGYNRSCGLCGNIGLAASRVICDEPHKDILVIELSSYQLELSQKISPLISVFTSFSMDHLGRHKNMKNYFLAKWRLVEATQHGGVVLLTRDVYTRAREYGLSLPQGVKAVLIAVQGAAKMPARLDVPTFYIDAGYRLIDEDGRTHLDFNFPKLRQIHNALNGAFSLFAANHIIGKKLGELVKCLADYKPLRHRYEIIGYRRGHPIINDSKSTNIESTIAALRSIDGRCILLMGGEGKGEDYQSILEYDVKIESLLCFGKDGPKIAAELISTKFTTKLFDNLEVLMTELPGIFSQNPAPILLSPGCASFDEFGNFEERGCFFSQKALELLKE